MGRDRHSKGKNKSKSKNSENAQTLQEIPVLELERARVPKHSVVGLPSRRQFLNWCREMSGDRYYTEQHMEQLLLNKLGSVYIEAFNTLAAYGYSDEASRKAILLNAHCFGKSDILANILKYSAAYIDTGMVTDSGDCSEIWHKQDYAEFNQSVKYSIAVMVHLLQHLQNLTKVDAMWTLLICNFHLGMVTDMKTLFADVDEPDVRNFVSDVSADFQKNVHELSKEDADLAERFKLPSHLIPQLKMNVAVSASAFRERLKVREKTFPDSYHSSIGEESSGLQDLKGVIDSNLKNKCVDEKDEIIMNLIREIEGMESEVIERRK